MPPLASSTDTTVPVADNLEPTVTGEGNAFSQAIVNAHCNALYLDDLRHELRSERHGEVTGAIVAPNGPFAAFSASMWIH